MRSCLIIGSSPCFTIGSTDASLCFAKIVPQTAYCRGSGVVAKRGLDPCSETAKLPGSSFYCKNQYTVTPTFKTPGKVLKRMHL